MYKRQVLMTPQGRTFNQSLAAELAASGGHLIILCGHYEGVDHRVVEEDVYKRQPGFISLLRLRLTHPRS